MDPLVVTLIIGFVILSLGVHEAAHAWVADLCGDDTAKREGRLTLNPVPHIDPVMTILLPAILAFSGGPIFGGARPVPVNPMRLRHPLRDMMLVALAGPISNFLQAIVYTVVLKILVYEVRMETDSLAVVVMGYTVSINLLLTAFNMIPVPPLDGSRVMAYLLPPSLREPYVGLERFGLLIVFALFLSGAFLAILWAVIDPLFEAVNILSGGTW